MVGWANNIADDPGGTRALALLFHSINVIRGPLGDGDGYWGQPQHAGSPTCHGQFVSVISDYFGGWGLSCPLRVIYSQWKAIRAIFSKAPRVSQKKKEGAEVQW